MDNTSNFLAGASSRPASNSVNDDLRRVASNLALVINGCGLSQSELSRRSGLSRQVINGWARARGAVSLSAPVGQLLAVVHLTLADLLLDEVALSRKLNIAPASDGAEVLPHLFRSSTDEACRTRFAAVAGTFHYRTRLKDSPMFVLKRIFQFSVEDKGCIVRLFEDRIGNRTWAEGSCFYYQSAFYVFVECSDPPHQPLIYAMRDPKTPKINSMYGVSIAPHFFSVDAGCPLARLVYMSRENVGDVGFDPDLEFNTFIPVDATTVLTTF